MYHTFYNLTTEPFRLSPDHRFCYQHSSYSRAKTYMTYALDRREGFVVVTGSPGTGKSTLIEDLFADLKGKPVVWAKLESTQLAADDLVRMVAYSFGIRAEGLDKATLISRLLEVLVKYRRAGRWTLLVVDEAQDLRQSALEELRLLTNLQQHSVPLLQIFLVGQQELRELIRDKSMEQLHQRIIAACHLEPLKAEETRAYVERRLVCAGWIGDPCISDAAFHIIHEFSTGVPRRINLVCSRLFLHGSVEERHTLLVADVREVLQELIDENLDPLDDIRGNVDDLVADIPSGLRDECTPFKRVTEAATKPRSAASSVQPKKIPVGNVQALHATQAQSDDAPVANVNLPESKARVRNISAQKVAPSGDVLGEVNTLLDDLDKTGQKAGAEISPAENTAVGRRTSKRPSVPEERVDQWKPPPSSEQANALDDPGQLKKAPALRPRWIRWAAALVFVAALIVSVVYGLNVFYGLKIDPFGLVSKIQEARLIPGDKIDAEVTPISGEKDLPSASVENEDVAISSQDSQMGQQFENVVSPQTQQQVDVEFEPGDSIGMAPQIAPERNDEILEQDAAVKLPPSAATLEIAESLPVQRLPEPTIDSDSASDQDGLVGVNTGAQNKQHAVDPESKTIVQSQDVEVVHPELPTSQPAGDADPDQAQNQAPDRFSSLEQALRLLPFSIDRLEDGSLEVDLGDTVTFAFDSAELRPSSITTLDKIAGALKPYSDLSLRVVGHTDSAGPAIYNLGLSEQRAAAVAKYLLKLRGDEGDWVQTEGRGESEPVEPGNPGRNRRIVLYITSVHQG